MHKTSEYPWPISWNDKKIVLLKHDSLPDSVDHAKVVGFAIGFEVLLQYAVGQPRQLLPLVHGGLDDFGELAGVFHIGGIDAQIVEGEVSHAPGQHDGKRVRLLAHGQPASQMRGWLRPARLGSDCSTTRSSTCWSRKKKVKANFRNFRYVLEAAFAARHPS